MKKFQILQAIFVEIGTYNDMTVRPYEANPDQSHINQIQQLTEYGRHISSTSLATVASQVLRPTAQAHSIAAIDNGWREPRFRFIIKVSENDDYQGLNVIKILQGYTSHVGMSHGGSVDPNMILYFNNVVVMRQVYVQGPSGSYPVNHVANADHVLRGIYRPSFGSQPDMTYLMRPEDVFTTMSNTLIGQEDVMDLRIGFAESTLKKSRRRNGSATHYLADVINNYQSAIEYSEHGYPVNNWAENARGALIESTTDQDAFLRHLKNGSVNFVNTGGITYGEICHLFNGFDAISTLMLAKKVYRSSGIENHQAGQTEYWTSANNETVWATILSQSVPSLMMDLMLTRIAFTATNQTIGNDYFIELADPCSFADGMDLSQHIMVFKNRLVNEVLKGLSSNNLIDFTIQMVVDVLGETRINISIAGGPMVEYATPSCCDALFSPVLASSQQQVEQLSYDIQQLSNGVVEQTSYQQSPPPMAVGGYNVNSF